MNCTLNGIHCFITHECFGFSCLWHICTQMNKYTNSHRWGYISVSVDAFAIGAFPYTCAGLARLGPHWRGVTGISVTAGRTGLAVPLLRKVVRFGAASTLLKWWFKANQWRWKRPVCCLHCGTTCIPDHIQMWWEHLGCSRPLMQFWCHRAVKSVPLPVDHHGTLFHKKKS